MAHFVVFEIKNGHGGLSIVGNHPVLAVIKAQC
jgi:hypothetical protein